MKFKVGDKVIINGQENIIENIVEDMVYLSHDFPIEMKHLERFQIAEKNHLELARTTWWREDMKQNDKDPRIGQRVLDYNGNGPGSIIEKKGKYYIIQCDDEETFDIEESHIQDFIDNYNKYNKNEQKGSGQRLDTGKINLADCPVGIIGYVAAVFMLNSKQYGGKYDHGNYLNGMKWSKVFNPMLRHIFKWLMGERLDKESGLPHLAHIAANIAILIEYEKIYPEGDDRLIKGQVTVDDVQALVNDVLSKRK